jgi:hypothetical protein
MHDPRDGLSLFGPFDADETHPTSPAYIVLGPPEGIAAFSAWSSAFNHFFLAS